MKNVINKEITIMSVAIKLFLCDALDEDDPVLYGFARLGSTCGACLDEDDESMSS